ncbi:MAG: TrkH family potassium uptake protein [Clostridia bacterium]|nr:TrkH family potassium uptake protein [Clostridia bacterium]
MNYKVVLSILGKAMLIEAALMLVPLLVGVYFSEDTYLSFLIPMAGLFAIGAPLSSLKSKDGSIYAKEGFVIVALAWVVLSVVGCVPFIVSGEIKGFADALFETASGFTTTGASVLDGEQVEGMAKSVMFWRILTHWLGGMGVLVFILAVLPNVGAGLMYVFRAESPGPSSGKLVGKMRHTARILYGIYVVLTMAEALLLLFGGMNLYDSVLTAFSTAGTGGFGVHDGSIAYYESVYVEMVVAAFMFLFGINFNIFYLILTGNILKALKSEELLVYVVIIVVASITVALNILFTLDGINNFWQAMRYSFFQVNTVSSTTGFSTANFAEWPALSKGILLFLTVIGASGGSTGGGMKVARLCILAHSAKANIRRMIYPRVVVSVKFEGKTISQETERGVLTYLVLYVAIACTCTLLLSFDVGDVFDNFSATLACISNVGPGITNMVGPMSSYAAYSGLSKTILTFVMLAGRLEIFPIIILFVPRTWKKG